MNDLQATLDEYRLLYKDLPEEDQEEIKTLAGMIPKCRVCLKQAAVFNDWYCSEKCNDIAYPPHLQTLKREWDWDDMKRRINEAKKRAHVTK